MYKKSAAYTFSVICSTLIILLIWNLDYLLYNTLCVHSVCNLQEACDVSACHIVAGHAVLLGSVVAALEDGNHDVVELAVNLVEGPAVSDGVLRSEERR